MTFAEKRNFAPEILGTQDERALSRGGRAVMNAPDSPDAFRASLKQRADAAKGLEWDLLTEVPQLYGSPDRLAPQGDPGIPLAKLHRDEMLRRNGGGVPNSTRKRSDVALPFERTLHMLAIVFLVLAFFLSG